MLRRLRRRSDDLEGRSDHVPLFEAPQAFVGLCLVFVILFLELSIYRLIPRFDQGFLRGEEALAVFVLQLDVDLVVNSRRKEDREKAPGYQLIDLTL